MRLAQSFFMTDNVSSTALDGYSITGGFVTNPVNIKHVYGFSITVSWSGNPSGTFQLEGCNDVEIPNNPAPGLTFPGLQNWVAIANSATLASAGVAIAPATNPAIMFNYSNTMYRFVRLHYIYTSGTLQVTARCTIKAGE